MSRLISLFLIILFLSASFAQVSTANLSLLVLEDETRLVLAEKQATVSLAVENPSDEFTARVRLELVAPNDYVQASREISQKIGRGRQNLTIPVETSNAFFGSDALLWYRLRYQIAPENSSVKTGGIISFSRILPEVFELKMIAGDYAFAEKMFRARVQAVNPANQMAVADVEIEAEIEIENRREKLKVAAKTDSAGFAALDFSLPKFESYADLNLKITGKKNGLTREVEDEIQGAAGTRAEVLTDKPIYQPNQSVNLRLYYYYYYRNRPVTGGELNVEIENEETDENVFAEKIKTSRFGIASAAWKIPESAKLGVYRIYIKDAEDNEIGSEQIKITRYELPNFYVEAKADRKYYLPGQTSAKIEINARYLFGKPVTGGRVRLVSHNDDEEIFKEIAGALDDEGKFSAEIELSRAFEEFEPDNYRRFKDYRFSAYVTDPTTNRTEPRSFDVRITDKPIHVYLGGETYGRSSRLPLDFYVTTFYADGAPASCEVGVYELLKKDADGKEIAPELGKLLAKVKTNAYGAARLRLPVPLPGGKDALDIKLIAADGKGLTGSFEEDIDVSDEPAIRIETAKTIYQKGEPVRAVIVSSEKKGAVFVETVHDFQTFDTVRVNLADGRAEVVLPYREGFKNTVEIVAYFEADDEELIAAQKSVIYPTPTNLEIEARAERAVYRPGEQVTVKFRSRNAAKIFGETALGVLVIDKAVEDRARTEAGTSEESSFLNRTFTSPMAGFFGQNRVFGDLTVRDVKNIDASKPLSPDLELAIEIALGAGTPRLEITRSRAFREDLDKLFNSYFSAKMKPVAEALDKVFGEKGVYPTDEKSLRDILSAQKIDFDALEDAWGNGFRADFRYERENLKMTVWSPGADELADTADDLTVLETNRGYFQKIGETIDKAMREYTLRTGGFITDYATLRDELLKADIDADKLRDPRGNAYRFEFTVDRTNYLLTVRSNGADRRADIVNWAAADDFTLWTSRADYFTATKANLIKGFNEYVEKTKTFPRSEAEMREILRASGFNLDEIKDVFGRPYYVQPREALQFGSIYRYQAPNLKAVRQKLLTFAVRSAGSDGILGNYDDFELASFTGATREEEIDASSRIISGGEKTVRQKTLTSPNGAIDGTVYDPNGAVIPGTTLSLTNVSRTFNRSVKSDENGYFLFDNLPNDVYALTASASGFRVGVITNLAIEPGVLLEIGVVLDVGSYAETVNVMAGSSATIDTSATKIATNVTVSRFPPGVPPGAPTFTPRVRDYFAETLVWMPELVTDKKGFAELKFKMADSLTTWKLYAIGSDENGDFGVVEKELQTFQPFFAELEPPPVLTEGDRIALPVPVRNYTDKKQKVAVSMAENDWSRIFGGASQSIEIPASATVNAIFDFQAIAPVAEGKQRVTAIAKKDGDAIEKPVTVRPNGKEIVETASGLFEKEASFDVNFPPNALANTRRAEIKIYPNMLAHVAESVEGLLKRPYGCGEQTTSSTYPNLLILKIEKELGKEIDAGIRAQAQKYLEEGYRRLLNYQTDSGGFSFWGNGDAPDAALTAYVLRFLRDAEDFMEVDENIIEKAENWLLSRQNADGSWSANRGATETSTAYILRSLSRTASDDARRQKALLAGIGFLKNRFSETNDAFVLANLALTAQAAGDAETARAAAGKLENLALPDKESLYWTTATTPFYGWGIAGRIETTALVVQAFLQMQSEKNNGQISRGLSFILKNKDRYGVWHSTQTTVNVLDALILLQKTRSNNAKNQNEKAEIYINGRKVEEFPVADAGLKKPVVFDASPFLNGDNNRVEIKISGDLNFTMAQVVSKHYINWSDAPENTRYFDLKIEFDKLQARVGEEITCRVRAQKKIYQSGMMLAEIGLPPGANVDRAGLEKAKTEGRFSSYDVLPDRVVIYSWASASPLEFGFKFRPRFGLNAQTAPSRIYDYYNEEAQTTVAPARFEVK